MFKIGEIVVCVDARRRWYKLGNLKENEMYTVVGFNPYDDGLILKETKSIKSGYNAYAKDRFRKVDYQHAEVILDKIQTLHHQSKKSSEESEIPNKN